MKVLMINGSPRPQGNSELLCQEFCRGAEAAGHQVEEIALRDKVIYPCKACYACFRTGRCVQKDAMAEILEKTQGGAGAGVGNPYVFSHPERPVEGDD